MGIGVAGPQWHALAAGCWSRLMVGRIVFHGRWVAILLTLVLASACSLLEKSARVEAPVHDLAPGQFRSEEHTSELQSLMRISYAVFCLKKTISSIHLFI